MDVDPNGPSAGALRPGDVIMSVNRQAVSSAAEAGRALQQVPAGRIAQIRIWRDGGVLFLPLRKEERNGEDTKNVDCRLPIY